MNFPIHTPRRCLHERPRRGARHGLAASGAKNPVTPPQLVTGPRGAWPVDLAWTGRGLFKSNARKSGTHSELHSRTNGPNRTASAGPVTGIVTRFVPHAPASVH